MRSGGVCVCVCEGVALEQRQRTAMQRQRARKTPGSEPRRVRDIVVRPIRGLNLRQPLGSDVPLPSVTKTLPLPCISTVFGD